MFQAKCLEKIRDKRNNIVGYKLVDKDKNEAVVKPNRLKEAIRAGQIEVINLILTSDNRLIDKKPATPSKSTTTPSKPSINVEAIINKAKGNGYSITAFDTDCGHKCYMASSPDNIKHLLIIPDDVEYIYDKNIRCEFDDIFKRMAGIQGTLKVVGGKGLTSTTYMFTRCEARYLDLKSFNTSNVTDMSWMFYKYSPSSMSWMFDNCEAQSLDLTSFNTSSVTNMAGMFCECRAQSIDLSSFNTSKVTNMQKMFKSCKAPSLDLSSFDTSKVTNMKEMFYCCKVQSIDLRSFNTSSVTNMESMFGECQAQSLDLSGFDTSKVPNMRGMFYRCEAQSLDLRSFNTSNVTDMHSMFWGCKAKSIDLSSFDTSSVTNMYSMFLGCKAQSLDLSSFSTSSIENMEKNMENMFYDCTAKVKATDRKILDKSYYRQLY